MGSWVLDRGRKVGICSWVPAFQALWLEGLVQAFRTNARRGCFRSIGFASATKRRLWLQVPGEMFSLAMEARGRGRGVVGSTSNILDFIADHVTTALAQPFLEPLQVPIPLASFATSFPSEFRSFLA